MDGLTPRAGLTEQRSGQAVAERGRGDEQHGLTTPPKFVFELGVVDLHTFHDSPRLCLRLSPYCAH